MRSYILGMCLAKIEVIKDDITELEVDAIVNAANRTLFKVTS